MRERVLIAGAVCGLAVVCAPGKSAAAAAAAEGVGIQIPCGASSFALPANAPAKLQEAALEYCLTQVRQAMSAPAPTPARVVVPPPPAAPAEPLQVATTPVEAPSEPPKPVIRTRMAALATPDEPIATGPEAVPAASAAKPAAAKEGADPLPPCKEGEDPVKNKCTASGDKAGGKDTAKSATVLSAKDFYVGSGFAISQTVGSRKAQNIKFVTRDDGRLLAQIQKSEDRDIGVMFETHYLLKRQGMFAKDKDDKDKDFVEKLGNFAACGPFSFIGEDDMRKGCGPLFTAILDSDGSISKFGIGWALGLGGKDAKGKADEEERAGFGIGVGLLFDRSAKTVDGRLVDKDTMLVRPEYQKDVAAGTISPIVERPTTSVFVMVSKTF